jgi:hypothetical protein
MHMINVLHSSSNKNMEKSLLYSLEHISLVEVFSKILKKPSMVQK